MARDKFKNAMIIGGGRISYYLAKRLLEDGTRVKIIEKDLKRCEELAELLPKAAIIHGDGSDKELLEEALYERMAERGLM